MARSPELGEGRLVELPQGRLRVFERGSGPPLLLVHGLFMNAELWRRVLPALSKRFHCVVPDLPLGAHSPAMAPGADLSPAGLARVVADLMTDLDLEDVTLVGNDTGGAICQIVVERHPERLGRLVLTNCDAFENFLPPALRPLQYAARVPGFVGAVAHALRLRPARAAFVATVARHRPEPEVLERVFGPLIEDAGTRRDVARVLAGISNRYTLEAARSFPGFRRPVLLVWGEDDFFFPVRYAERLRDAFPDARLETVARSRAFVPEDRPDALAPLIEDFVS